MNDPTRTVYVQSHLDELRSEAEHERLAALRRSPRHGRPERAGRKRQRERDGRLVSRIDAALRPFGATGGRS
jgi:hypothetical protein